MNTKVNQKGERTRKAIITEGLNLMRRGQPVSARRIGDILAMTHTAVLYHFDNIENLQFCVAMEAVAIGDKTIVPALIVANHKAVSGMTQTQKRLWLAEVA